MEYGNHLPGIVYPAVSGTMMRKTQTRRGFSLVETVVSISLLSAASISVVGLGVYSAKIQAQGEARSTALFIARRQLDAIESVSQSNRTSGTRQTLTIPTELRNQMPQGTSGVEAFYSILPVAGTKNLQQLVVTVSWRNASSNGSGRRSSVSASKMISSVINMDWLQTNGWDNPPIGQLFYSPPPPPPPKTREQIEAEERERIAREQRERVAREQREREERIRREEEERYWNSPEGRARREREERERREREERWRREEEERRRQEEIERNKPKPPAGFNGNQSGSKWK